MSNALLKTLRFLFQGIGGSQELEPDDYNAILAKLDSNLNEDNHAAADFTLGTDVAFTYERPQPLRMLRLTITNLLITLAGATTSCVGNATLLTWPATSNLCIAGARMNLTCVKDGVTLLSTDQPLVAVGHAVTAASDLSTTSAKSTIDAVTLAATLSAAAQKNGAGTPALRFISKGASNILNLAVGISTKAGGTLTVSGTVDVFYYDTGNFSSLTA